MNRGQYDEGVRFLLDMLSDIGEGVIVSDSKGLVTFINDAAQKLTGWSKRDAIGKSIDETFPLIHFITGESIESPIWSALACDKTTGLKDHTALLTHRGDPILISASCTPICSHRGKTEGVVVVFRDINQIKSAEDEIQKEKNNLKSVLEALQTGIMLVDRNVVVDWINKPLLNLLNVEEEEVIGKRFGDGAHCVNSYNQGGGLSVKCQYCVLRQTIYEVIQEGTSYKNVIVKHNFLCRNTEKKLWFKLSFIPVVSEIKEQVIVVLDDITGQKDYEEALQRSRDEAESANRIKSEFISNMSHEIRTPLNGLVGMMELIRQTELDKEQTEYIQMAKECADNLLKIIGKIMDFSKIESGSMALSCAAFILGDFINETIQPYERMAEKKGVEFSYEVACDLSRYLLGDTECLRQILSNLIENAVKFTDTGAVKVLVRIISQDEKNISLEFNIADTGIGISTEKLDVLFMHFTQGDGSFTRVHGGLGLGLAISKQLVHLMGGRIQVESREGQGTSFKVTLSFPLGNEIAQSTQDDNTLDIDQKMSPFIIKNGERNWFIKR